MKQNRLIRIDKSGKPFEIEIGCIDDLSSLLEMYRTFSPKPASQGLPPEDPETCQNWLKTLFRIGLNALAWRCNSIIGHVALIRDVKRKSGELVIYVDQNHRNLGIGTELTRFALERSGQLGYDSIWLTVNVTNFIAIKLYKKLGFQYSDLDGSERVMRIVISSES